MKTVELFKVTNNGKEILSKASQSEVDQTLKILNHYGLPKDNLKIESLGMFKASTKTYFQDSMSQAAIAAGGENDPFEVFVTHYEKI